MSISAAASEAFASSAPDPAARFESLVLGRLDRAYRLAGLLLGNAADAEDAVGDALASAWRAFPSLQHEDRFDSWFDRILVNGCRDRLRRRKVVRFVPVDGDHASGGDPFADVLARDEVLRRIEGLPSDERAIVVLHYWADLPLDGVAERLDLALGTVKSRLHRALERMRADAASTGGPR